MMNFRKDLLYLLLLLGMGMVFWGEALTPGRMFFFRDIPAAIVVKKLFWSGSGWPTLWSPYAFFGVPHAANPQSEAFYPLNFFFLLFGPERGVVYDVVLHHLFFLLTFYLALRKVGFKEESGLMAAAGFGFGGYLISLAPIPLFFRTIAWLGVLIICLDQALRGRWFRWSLILGLVMGMQLLGGEVQLAGMSWFLALALVVLGPRRAVSLKDLFKGSGALAVGLVGCVIVYLPQIALTRELLPLSNRAAGLGLEEATLRSLAPNQLGSLIVPNYLNTLSFDSYWYLGFFYGFPYFLSHYLGVTLLLLMVFSFAALGRLRLLFWVVLSYLGLAMILGDHLGVYTFFYKYLPGFSLFKFPEKFFLFLNFGFALLAVYGYEYVSGRKLFFPWGAGLCLFADAVIIIFLFVSPLRLEAFGNNNSGISAYLFRRSILQISVFFLAGLGMVLLAGKARASWLGLGLALAIFLDLYSAHQRLNPVTTEDFFRPNDFVRGFFAKEKNIIVPPRIFPIEVFPQRTTLKELTNMPVLVNNYRIQSLSQGWALYFGLNDAQWDGGTLYPREGDKFLKLLEQSEWPQREMIFARSGVEYLYYLDRGFTNVPGAFSRAMVFYQAYTIPDQYQVIKLWSNPDFPVRQTLLVEADPVKTDTGSSSLSSEPARITEYRNEKVKVEAEAKEPGWLLLLDTYYPGWKATVDGQPAEIYRANGFFRAVRIPVGKHEIVFKYYPGVLNKAFWVSGVGLLIWLGLLVSTIIRGRKKEKAI